jgi:ketosteroid isomerase-like protein
VSADFGKLLDRARDAYNARDPEAWLALWTTDCEWHPFLTARVEGDPGYHGHNGIRAWFEDVDEMFVDMHVDLEQFREVHGRVLAFGRMTARSRTSGAEVSNEVAWVFEPRGERFQRGWSYNSHTEAEREAESLAPRKLRD